MIRAILLAAACVILAAAAPPAGQASSDPDNDIVPALDSIAGELKTANEPEPIEAVCAKGTDLRYSDLCAQWKAADAAADSAWWTKYAFWVGLFSLIALGASLRYTHRALVAAESATEDAEAGLRLAEQNAKTALEAASSAAEANKIARESLAVQDRAWIRVEAEATGPLRIEEEASNFRLELNINLVNIGRGPALDLHVSVQIVSAVHQDAWIKQREMAERELEVATKNPSPGGVVFPGSNLIQPWSIIGEPELLKKLRDAAPPGVSSFPLFLAVVGVAYYKLPGSEVPRLTGFALEITTFELRKNHYFMTDSHLPIEADAILLLAPYGSKGHIS